MVMTEMQAYRQHTLLDLDPASHQSQVAATVDPKSEAIGVK